MVDILAMFAGTVIVLPGSHDYYTGNEPVWRNFEKALSSREHSIVLMKEFKPYLFSVGEEEVVLILELHMEQLRG